MNPFNWCRGDQVISAVLFGVSAVSEVLPFLAKKFGFKGSGILDLIYCTITSKCLRKKYVEHKEEPGIEIL